MPKPMLTDDYLIRMINQAIAVLLTIVRLKADGQYQEAQQYIEQSLEQLIGLRINLIRGLDDHNILNTLTMNGALDTNRIIIVADLFKEDGDILAAQNKMNASNWSYQRALYFYLICDNNGGPHTKPDLTDKIDYLASILKNVPCQIETEFMLSNYFERSGKYSEGYQVLKKLSESQELQDEAIFQRIGYLERLINLSDDEVLEGWMNPEEIIEEIAILQGEIGK
ncbi:MAG: hypothetical protein KAS38_16785 [Anaerolineales bacterium]|jgi:hypothetical protein|nr:hypothetical protein [Anaerolineales bacterium]